MKKQGIIILSVVAITGIALAVSYQQGLLPVQNMPAVSSTQNQSGSTTGDMDTSISVSTSDQENWAQSIDQPEELVLSYEGLAQLLSNVDVNQRQALLDDEAAFGEFIASVASQKSLLAAAKSNNLHQNPDTSYLMQRSAENTLMEVYLNRLINNKLPEGFPTDEQISQYFESNKDNLVVEERVSVWQIFIPAPEGTTEPELAELEAQASQIANDIRAGRADFTNAALTYSQHQPSKLNGGYMGILKVSELIPGIHEPVMELEEGEVSDPVRTEMGFHVLKRDQVIPSQSVTLDQVRTQIRNLLINQVRANLRNEIIKLAGETYPIEYDETEVSDWRTRLQNDL